MQLWINRTVLTIAVILAAGIAWRHLVSESIWYDEAITLLTVAGHAVPKWSLGPDGHFFEGTAGATYIVDALYHVDVHPPLYFWALALWRQFTGTSLEAARMLSACFVIATALLIYRVAYTFTLPYPSVPAVLFLFSAAAVKYAYTARAYGMAVFLIVLTLLLAQRRSLFTGLCAAAAFATHYFTLLCVAPVLFIYCCANLKRYKTWSAVTLATFIACSALLIPLLVVHFTARPAQFTGFGSVVNELIATVSGPLYGVVPYSTYPIIRKLFLLTAPMLLLIGAYRSSRHSYYVLPLTYILYVSAFCSIAFLTNKSVSAMPGLYYHGIISPFLVLMIGCCITHNRIWLIAPALFLIAASAITSPERGTGYREIIEAIRSECNECAVVVGAGFGRGIPGCVVYEANGLPVFVLDSSDNDVSHIITRTRSFRTLFFIPSNEPATQEAEQRLKDYFIFIPRDRYFHLKAIHPLLQRAAPL